MQVKKTVTVVVETTDGKEVKVGNRVNFETNSGVLQTGIFAGFTDRGLWRFTGYGPFSKVEYSMHPKGIKEMYLAE